MTGSSCSRTWPHCSAWTRRAFGNGSGIGPIRRFTSSRRSTASWVARLGSRRRDSLPGSGRCAAGVGCRGGTWQPGSASIRRRWIGGSEGTGGQRRSPVGGCSSGSQRQDGNASGVVAGRPCGSGPWVQTPGSPQSQWRERRDPGRVSAHEGHCRERLHRRSAIRATIGMPDEVRRFP